VHDVFVTDVEYDTDEVVACTYVVTPGNAAAKAYGSRTVEVVGGLVINPNRDLLKENSMVRFVNDATHVVTTYMRVTRAPYNNGLGGGVYWFDVDTAVVLGDAIIGVTFPTGSSSTWKVMLARTWIPKALKLQTRFKDVTAVEVRRVNWTGLSASTLEDQADILHDYVGLEIQEIPGSVIATNRWMHKVLAVVPTHPPGPLATVYEDTRDAIVELAPGDAKTEFTSPITLSQVTPRLIDRKGKPIIVARLHIWLRIWAKVA
jgi:hypothetical protein